MSASNLQDFAIPSLPSLDQEDGSDVVVRSKSTTRPAAPRSTTATASVASPYTANDTDAVAIDPAALWAALDLSAPESTPSQHTSRRVVLLGRPLSGKRTLCRRLCFAAEAQYAGSSDATDVYPELGGFPTDNDRQPLYRPSSDDDEDSSLFPNQRIGGWNMPGTYATAGSLPQSVAVGPHDRASLLSHGSGVCFDYVVQRVPMRVLRSGGDTSGDFASANKHGSTGLLSTSLGGTVRRTTEFFICDSPGALSMALPTLDHVESALVLMVVDVSDVSKIRQQLDYCYSTLDGYVTNLLRAQAPNHDAVRHMQLAAAQQDYWLSEEQKLRSTRTNLANSSEGTAGTAAAASASASASLSPSTEDIGDVLFKDPMINIDKVNSTTFRVPASAGTVCAMRSILVCTKVECLDRVSRAVGLIDSGTPEHEAVFDRLGVRGELRLAMQHSRQSLISLVSQLVRQYAICHRAALASVCWRVSMTTAGAEGEYAHSTVVNPFYKGLWSYIAYVLYKSKDATASVPSDVLRVCSARMHPHALLPFGLDHLDLLNPFVTSGNVQLPEGRSLTSPEDASDSAIRTTADSVITPDRVFSLHQKYIQQAQTDLKSAMLVWSNAEEEIPQCADTMVWDTI
ncbi:hypothetical protein JKF63_06782 [Porcisia hertigi]|uniref:Uncharacterized protein n=1 Tax=Porcisia hertigi TaxID=2761500 RepID=A0A836I158_9TRYP|nr:hypothetical protein JKF63_06782 [Porcisia hertigi]